MKKLSLLFIVFFLSIFAFSQRYGFKQYTSLNGLPQNFIYTIFQDDNGNLVIGTGEGISIFNGIKFKNYSEKDGLGENAITCANKTATGSLLFGHNEGSITKFIDGNFVSLRKYLKTTSAVTGIVSVGDEIIFCTQNEGLFHISSSNKVTKLHFNEGTLYNNLLYLENNQLLVGTTTGLYAYKINGSSVHLLKRYFEGNNISTITQFQKTKKIIFSVSTKGIFTYQLNQESGTVSRFKTVIDEELEKVEVTSVIMDKNKTVWIGTLNKGIYSLTINTYTKQQEAVRFNSLNGLETDFIKTLYEDHEGNIWIGSFGNGLLRPLENYFVFFPTYLNEQIFDASAFAEIENEFWLGLKNGILVRKNDGTEVLFNEKNGFADVRVTSLKTDNGNMWIGTEKSGIYFYDNVKEKFIKQNWNLASLENYINDLEIVDNSLWVASQGGLLNYDFETQEISSYGTESGLPHNYISTLCLDNEGSLLIGTQASSLLKLKHGELVEIPLIEKGVVNILDIYADHEDNIWIATAENGVLMTNRDTIISYTLVNGLKSNYCYSIHSDSKNNIWVGHSNGLSKIYNSHIKTYDYKEGVTGRVNHRSIFRGKKGYLWIGTTDGLVQYDNSKELKNLNPPIANILRVLINDKEIDFKKQIDLPAGNYKVTIEFSGVSFIHPEGVKYQFKLKGFEEDFSILSTSAFTTYGKVGAGNYEFQFIACNNDGECSEVLSGFTLSIDLPFYQKTWVQIMFIILFMGIVYGILRYRTFTLKQRQIQLEQEITIKTAEIVNQKNKIQSINKDISDSINYAEKIQRRIMPEHEELTSILPGSFVYFSPKDVVSGDFYYFYDTGDKFIVAVGDCTGHGVPGAFMTFIGKITLRNIFTNYVKDNLTPSDVLRLLDAEVESILSQNDQLESDDYYKSRDGMDIVICEIDKSNNYMRFASAMRPVVVDQDGHVSILRGTRLSIGGGFTENKTFDLNEIALKRGDKIYLFSDGVSDQFGGHDNKKLKIEGIIKMMESANSKNSEENYKQVKFQFESWMENKKQIDDVILIAIHL